MQIKKLLVASVIPFSLMGCPDKPAETKPDPATSAKPATTAAAPAKPAAAASAAPAKSGGW